ncbi:MAG: hypothetical protein U0931_04635 [Vulcanimicrobiota bacterium]
MSCQLDDNQIQSWLDGECDLHQHLQVCPDCQLRLSAMQKLRGRLTPPPSPLGRDFARRTAAHILKVSDKVGPSRPWSLRENPLIHIVQRERARRMVRAPHPLAIALLYLLPGAFVFNYGDADASWAYFGMLRLGLTVLVPLLLLSLEWVTLSSLVRGRCLEEILQTGLPPAMVSDTLALNGLRSLLPALLVTGLALLPIHPQGLLMWLPMTLVAFSAAGYLSQAHLVGRTWARWLTLVGATLVTCSLAAPLPWNVLGGALLVALGWAARAQSIQSLNAQQQGLPQRKNSRRILPFQTWLAARLPELAVLQRELRRRNLFGMSILGANLGICAAAYTMFGRSAYCWPLFAAGAALLSGFGLVNREKDSGAFDVLTHSGLQPRDWWLSAQWLAGVQMAPSFVAAVAFAAWQASPLGLFSLTASALGTACSLLVSLHAGAVIGTTISLNTTTSRQAAFRTMQEVARLALTSLLILGLVPALLGPRSLLTSLLAPLGIEMHDALEGFAVLPVMLALYWRSRSLRESSAFNPWTTSLAFTLPVCIWVQVLNSSFYRPSGESSTYAGFSLLLGLAWSWWAAPLAQKPGPRRWAGLVASYTLTQLLGLPVLMWCLTILHGFAYDNLPEALADIETPQLLAFGAASGWLIYLLGILRDWKAPAAGNWRSRSLWAGGLALCGLTFFGLGLAHLKNQPRVHASEFETFLSGNRNRPQPASLLRPALRSAQISENMYLSQFQVGNLNDDYNRRDYDKFRQHSQEFQNLFGRLLRDPAVGNQRDREWALQLLEMQCNDHLHQLQTELVLADLEQSRDFCVQASRLRYRGLRNQCLRLRSRAFLACRGLAWNRPQLDRLEQVLNSLPDDEKRVRASQDKAVAEVYQIMRSSNFREFETQARGRLAQYYMEQQAELFLDRYLDGQTGQTGRDLASNYLWRLTWNRQLESDQWKIAVTANRLALALERMRLQNGRYPASLPTRDHGLRLAYRVQPDGTYSLKIWLARVPHRPLMLTSLGASYMLTNSNDYFERD